jgi:Cytochrome c554 and c-prime
MRWLLACLLAGVVIAAEIGLSRDSTHAQAPAPEAALAAGPSGKELRGAGSCAAAACHNGNGRMGEKGSEYTTWVLHDPHSHAYEVLFSNRSKQIEKNRILPDGCKEIHPTADPLCLNCHVQPGIVPLVNGGEKLPRCKTFSLADGVSCEACHGAAGGWLAQHHTNSWLSSNDMRPKAAAGMTATKDLRVRAEVCVACHVGKGDIEVNHDLIAAGHPRLYFEYAAYHAKLPKHWSEEKDMKGRPDIEARAWAIGQAVSAKAALELLAYRAEPKNMMPWPEFAEYDCFACHHDLKAQSWRQARGYGSATPGALPWGTWYFSMLGQALDTPGPKDVADELSLLRAEMKKPYPGRKQISAKAGSVADGLEHWVAKLRTREYGETELHDKLAQVAADEQHLCRENWDGAVQVYLAIKALYSARGNVDPRNRDPRLKAHLQTLGRQLEFSREQTCEPRYDSPHDFDPDKVQKLLEAIRQGLRR